MSYIQCGTNLRFLQDAKAGRAIHGAGWTLENLEVFLWQLDTYELPVTKQASSALVAFAEELREADDGAMLTEDQAERLSEETERLRHTLTSEAQLKIAYVVTSERVQVDKLLEDVGSLMPPDVFDSLPPLAQYDFAEAGRCIAFEVPTAAAFHLLRATEEVLKHFYRSIVKQKRLKTPMWGPMVDQLRARKTKRPPYALLDHLDNVRNNFRNPTQHPEKVYDIHEAHDLFNLCMDVVARMARSADWEPLIGKALTAK